MNILYDITVLGVGQCNPLSRTGISRVIENVLDGLLTHPDCQLSLCSTPYLPMIRYCLEYLDLHPKLKAYPFVHSNFLTLVHNQLLELSHRLDLQRLVGEREYPEPRFSKALLENLQSCLTTTEKVLLTEPLLTQKDLGEVDIFHATFYPIPEVVKAAKVQRFLTVYDLIPILFPQYFDKTVQSTTMHLPTESAVSNLGPEDWVLTISQSTKNDLCNFTNQVDPERVIVTHLAADPTLFYPCSDLQKLKSVRQKYKLSDGPYILGLSTMEPRKNFDRLVLAFAQLVNQERINDLSLVLVGNQGWLYGQIFEEINKNPQIRNRITFTGRVEDEDLAALYSGAMAFAYPSIYEGFGLPPLEAMQCGVPVVCSNTSSLPEVVEDAGLLVDPMDVDGLAQSLLQFYQHPSLREEMAKKSLEQAKKFSWANCVEQTVAAYRKSLAA